MAHRDHGSVMDLQSDGELHSPPFVITVRRHENTAYYDLAEVEPLIQNIQIEFDEHLISHLLKELKTVTDSLNRFLATKHDSPDEELRLSEEIVFKFKRLGRIIYEQLIPVPIQKALSLRPTGEFFLRLEDSLLEIPWELTFDGEQFLSQRFRIGRQVITSLPFYKTAEGCRTPSKRQPTRLLIVIDPTESLPAAFAEAEALADALDQQTHLEVEVIGGKRASKLEILSALSEFEIVHFAGHSIFDPADSGKSGWLLHDTILTTAEMSKISNPPLLVFSNSCESALTQRWDRPSPLGQASLGIGSGFLLAGVRHYVGALWVVHDSSSARFAGAFYRRLFEGKTIGEALLRAKTENLEIAGFEDLMNSGYVHYGRSDDRVVDQNIMQTQTVDEDIRIVESESSQLRIISGKLGRRGLRKLCLFILLFAILTSVFAVSRSSFQKDDADFVATEYLDGVAAYHKGSIAKAMATFQRLINREDNKYGLGYGDLAEIYLEAGVMEKAKTILADAAGKPICSTMTHILRGHMAFQEGNIYEAEIAYTQALGGANGLPEQMAEAYNSLGLLSFFSGKKENAVDFFNSALSRQRANPDALFNLGFIAYLNNDRPRARQLMEKAANLDPDDELTPVFLESASNGAALNDSQLAKSGKGMREGIFVIGPFGLRGGTIKRLGVDWVFAHLLTRRLATTAMARQYALRVVTPFDIPNGYLNPTKDPSMQYRLLDVFRSLGAKVGLFGDIFLFQHVIYANVRAVDVASGAILRSINLKAEGPEKIHKLVELMHHEIGTSF
ncbi:MAG: CHAT domain-containing protein [Syntrophaceae bacterium]|nr:CHAT domain-containing protein [Syntrophaceae bacterium]